MTAAEDDDEGDQEPRGVPCWECGYRVAQHYFEPINMGNEWVAICPECGHLLCARVGPTVH